MARTRDWRRWKRHVKMLRRLKKDWNQHYRELDCPCQVDPKFRSIMADTPKRCSKRCCGNYRRHGKGKGKLTLAERRFTADRDV
jgi:hypothetical protein